MDKNRTGIYTLWALIEKSKLPATHAFDLNALAASIMYLEEENYLNGKPIDIMKKAIKQRQEMLAKFEARGGDTK